MSEGGIYKIQNTVNGKRYIGSAVDLKRRWCEHRVLLRRGEHTNQKLQRAWDKYGEAVFEFIPMLLCNPSDLIPHEQLALDGLKPEYNIAPTAGSSLGVKHTPEARARMSAAKRSPKARARMSALRTGAKASLETRARMCVARVGKKNSSKTRARMSAGQVGKKKTPEHCAAISAGQMGKRSGRKMSAAFGRAISLSKRAANDKTKPPSKRMLRRRAKYDALHALGV